MHHTEGEANLTMNSQISPQHSLGHQRPPENVDISYVNALLEQEKPQTQFVCASIY